MSVNGILPIDLLPYRLSYTLRRYYVDSFHAEHVAKIEKGSKVLDLAGNKIMKRGQFDIGQYDLQTIYSNITVVKQPDVQADAFFLPFADETFDVVICSELLEHVKYPPAVLQEIFRVLRKNGMALICVPFLYQIHADPYDFGRYTDYYWISYFSEIGFRHTVVEKQGLFWSVLVDMTRSWWYELSKNGKLRFPKLITHILAYSKKFAIKQDSLLETKSSAFFSSFTTGFGIVAVK